MAAAPTQAAPPDPAVLAAEYHRGFVQGAQQEYARIIKLLTDAGSTPVQVSASVLEKPAILKAGPIQKPVHRASPLGDIHPAGRKLLEALARHSPARFTWTQAALLAGLKANGGHFNAGRKSLRDAGYIEEAGDLVSATATGLAAAGEVPASPSTPAERLELWCSKLPSPAPDMLRALADFGIWAVVVPVRDQPAQT